MLGIPFFQILNVGLHAFVELRIVQQANVCELTEVSMWPADAMFTAKLGKDALQTANSESAIAHFSFCVLHTVNEQVLRPGRELFNIFTIKPLHRSASLTEPLDSSVTFEFAIHTCFLTGVAVCLSTG